MDNIKIFSRRLSASRKRKRRVKLRSRGAGAAPGTLITPPDSKPPTLSVLAYGPSGFAEEAFCDPNRIKSFLGVWPVVWVNVDGLGDAQLISEIGERFSLHRLALEDVLNAHQRPKVEQFGTHYFMVTQEVTMNEVLESEQLSLFLGHNFVITFQERCGDQWNPIRDRIRNDRGKIRGAGADYLLYSLLDTVVDSYFPLVESFDLRLETLEDNIVVHPERTSIAQIHHIKRDLLFLRRAVWPLREAVNVLLRDNSALIHEDTRLYLRDCYDHVIRIIELTELYRELGSGLMELHLTVVSNRMNEIIKVLTIISTIFMPLSFIAGVYGMNFNTGISPLNMPELNWYWGYPFALAVMTLVALAFLLYFRRLGWFNPSVPLRQLLENNSETEK